MARKTRYNKITLKLTTRQRKSLEAYCKRRNTSPVRFIKSAIKHALKDGHQVKQLPKDQAQMDLEDLIKQLTDESQQKGNQDLPFPDDSVRK